MRKSKDSFTERHVRLRVERQRRGMKQPELSRKSGINQGTISAIETGHLTRLYPSQAKAFAKVFGMSVKEAEKLTDVVEVELSVRDA